MKVRFDETGGYHGTKWLMMMINHIMRKVPNNFFFFFFFTKKVPWIPYI